MSPEPEPIQAWTCSSLCLLCPDRRGKILGRLKPVQTKLTEEANQQVSELLFPLYTVCWEVLVYNGPTETGAHLRRSLG